MDTVTHFIAGAVTPLAFSGASRHRSLFLFGALAGEFPDIDVFFGNGSIHAFLTLHRGITHALVAQPFSALLLAGLFWLYLKGRKKQWMAAAETIRPPSFMLLFCIALVALYMHLFLDSMTTFGTQLFLPFNDMRVQFPAMFIIDLLLTGVAFILFMLAWRKKTGFRLYARLALLWLVFYPVVCLGYNVTLAERLTASAPKHQKVVLLPEPFSPFVWKYVRDEGDRYMMGVYNTVQPHQMILQRFMKPDWMMYKQLEQQNALFTEFSKFAPLMVMSVDESESQEPVYSFMDLRYIMAEQGVAQKLGQTDTRFIFEAKMSAENVVLAYRFLYRSSATDTPWCRQSDGIDVAYSVNSLTKGIE